MRFVPTNCLREGMILADNLYNNYGELLLSGGLVLNEDYLKSIRRLNTMESISMTIFLKTFLS